MHRLMLHALLALTLVLCALPAQAEGKRAEEKRAKVEQRLKQVTAKILRQEVGLDDQKADEVMKVLVKHQVERRTLQQQHRQHRKAIGELLQSDSSDEAQYKKSIDGFRTTQKKLNGLRDREMDEIAKLITPKQQAKLFRALERMRRKLARRQRGPD